MFTLTKRLRERGVLGINRRNADYIMLHNPRAAYPIVDDKALTKELASIHRIPIPETYHILSCHGEVRTLHQKLAHLDQFVVKPTRGAGGSGIVLVTGRSGEGFVKSSGKLIYMEDLRFHVEEILSGIYSLEGREDKVLIESLVQPHEVFEAVSYKGVPDVRIIVYKGVPAMAMVRLPTKASDGKANLHKGAIGAGIVIATGRTLRAVCGKMLISEHPETGNPVAGIELPYWKEMLLLAAKASDMTGLGYLGVDLVLDRNLGPLLLELNARPGLAIQIANGRGLVTRLQAIEARREEIGPDPEERVEWAMDNLGDS